MGLAPSSLQKPRGPVTLKSYANAKHWYNWAPFCRGSDSQMQQPYCKYIFIGTIPASPVSQIIVLKVQKYISTALCQVKGQDHQQKAADKAKPEGLSKGVEEGEEMGAVSSCTCVTV